LKTGTQLENIPRWGKNILRGRRQTYVCVGGGEYTKYNKNINSEHFRRASPPSPP